MKSKRQRKRNEQGQSEPMQSKSEQGLGKIKFEICRDSIACFISDRRSLKKRNSKVSSSVKKGKSGGVGSSLQKQEVPSVLANKAGFHQSESEEIVQGSLNTIVSEIESKGIGCVWSEGEQAPEEINDNDATELWTPFSSLAESSEKGEPVEKSPASTVDVRPKMAYFLEDAFYPTYSYSTYSYKPYEESTVFVVQAEHITADPRTTVMIRNIPNKYTIKELSEEIDCRFANSYDFLYLPCDIKNQCNVGYGFINFLSTHFLADFYRLFQGRRWSKFRSEKICNLTYARLQGLDSLIDHFENSKVLNQKDKRYRPIIREFAKIETLIKTQQLN